MLALLSRGEMSETRGRRLLPGPNSSSEAALRPTRRHISPPQPHDPVCRKRSFSTGSSDRAYSSNASLTGSEMGESKTSVVSAAPRTPMVRPVTADRVFPAQGDSVPLTPQRHRTSCGLSPSEKFATWSGDGPTESIPVRCRSAGQRVSHETPFKSELGEKRRVAVPGQQMEGLFRSDEAPVKVNVRPLLRQKHNCKSIGTDATLKPYRPMRRAVPIQNTMHLLDFDA